MFFFFNLFLFLYITMTGELLGVFTSGKRESSTSSVLPAVVQCALNSHAAY